MYPINPVLRLPDRNIFNIRQENYDQLMEDIEEILKVPLLYGFQIDKFEKVDTRYRGNNLINTVKENIVLKLSKGGKVIDLSMQIPKLINGQWFIINKRKKIPKYQLFDTPILTFDTPKNKEIRIQTNIGRISVFWKYKKKNKFDSFITMTAFGRSIPFSVVLNAFYGPDIVKEKFLNDISERDILEEDTPTIYQLLQLDLLNLSSEKITQEEFVRNIGVTFSERNPDTKGSNYMFSIKHIFDIDIITKKFIEEDNIIDCLSNIIKNDIWINDLNYDNKRIRCFEYAVLQYFITNVYKLCVNCRDETKPKFNVSKTKILGDSNTSDIIQFDFSINPIDQIAQIAQISLTGPNGFKKKQVPTKLRDLDRTMTGRICSVDTPDRENCGVVQNLVPTARFDDRFKFIDDNINKSNVITSIPITMIPFLEHTDQTRLQMASGQMKQSILLKDFHIPLICSGAEKSFSAHSSFLYKAKNNGEVLFISKKYIIIGYNNGEICLYDIGVMPITAENMNVMITDLSKGDKVSKDQIITYSVFCKNENITIGQNFKIAFMSYYGYNHEDGIVISDRLVNDGCLTSQHYVDMSFNISPTKVLLNLPNNETGKYEPLYPVGTLLKKGDVYAILKEMYLFGAMKNNSWNVFEDSSEKIAKYDLLIEDISLYANDWYTDMSEYDNWVRMNIEKQIEKNNIIMNVIISNTDKKEAKRIISENNLDSQSHPGMYKNKDEIIKGIRIDINGIYERPIQIGDKLANRHGNKGVITIIKKHDQMPQLPDGTHIDICLNPVGVISRMNTGQLFELSLSKSLIDLKNKMKQMVDDKIDQHIIKKYLIDYLYLTDKTSEKWIVGYVKNNLPDEIDHVFIDDLYLIQPMFSSINNQDLHKIMKYTETNFEEKIFDPVSGEYVINEIATGYMYLMKLIHIAEKKLAYRSIGITSQKTMQPVAGKINNGGQRCGEMESICLVSNDMPINQYEFYTTKSDCVDGKNNFLKKALGTDYLDLEENPDMEPETLKLFKANMMVIGLDIDGEL